MPGQVEQAGIAWPAGMTLSGTAGSFQRGSPYKQRTASLPSECGGWLPRVGLTHAAETLEESIKVTYVGVYMQGHLSITLRSYTCLHLLLIRTWSFTSSCSFRLWAKYSHNTVARSPGLLRAFLLRSRRAGGNGGGGTGAGLSYIFPGITVLLLFWCSSGCTGCGTPVDLQQTNYQKCISVPTTV